MIKIAVCDDEPVMCQQLKQLLSEFFTFENRPFDISCFANGLSLLASPFHYDLIFLDIQLPNINGVELAKRLRSQKFDGVLIFVTVLADYMPDAFEVEATDYLLKPIDQTRFRRTLQRVLKRLDDRLESSLFIQTANWCKSVKFGDIYYCEVRNRKIYLHTKQGIIDYYGKMKELEQQSGPHFIKCHRSFLVNPDYLSQYTNGLITLENGEKLPVSRQHHSLLMNQMLEYMAKQNGI